MALRVADDEAKEEERRNTGMKCITVRQPWAWAIFHGKDVENRDWPTRVRGRVAVHAARGMTEQEYVAAYAYCEARGVILPMPPLLFRGVVLGTV